MYSLLGRTTLLRIFILFYFCCCREVGESRRAVLCFLIFDVVISFWIHVHHLFQLGCLKDKKRKVNNLCKNPCNTFVWNTNELTTMSIS